MKERSASKEHVIDLSHLLGEPTPAEADPAGEWYCFERDARKDTGGDGWADVWKRGCFAWEYKGRRADLDAAFNQLRQYAFAWENPLLIVSDMVRFHIRTSWTNSVSVTQMKQLLYWILATISLSGCSVAMTPSDLSASESDRTVSASAGFGEFDRVNWTVTCGLPTRDNPLIDLLSTQFELGPFARNAGHMLAKKLSRPHPQGGLSTEMWVLSPVLGEWWRLKAIRVHPEDLQKLTSNAVEDVDYRDVRQIVNSPFLPEPIVVRGGDDEAVVDVQILARLPEVSRLRCRP